jgi:lipopolysaccharide export system protein LptA
MNKLLSALIIAAFATVSMAATAVDADQAMTKDAVKTEVKTDKAVVKADEKKLKADEVKLAADKATEKAAEKK